MTEWELRLIQEHRNRNTATLCASIWNASGNLKKPVTPDDFLPSVEEYEPEMSEEEKQAAYVAMMMGLAKNA